MDEYLIDNHKLIYHPKKVSEWLERKDIYPIYIEISPCSICNHRCIFCAFDYLGCRSAYLDKKVFKKFIKEISIKGVKSILFSGEGEPLLCKNIPELTRYAKGNGLDVAITTNGALLNKSVSKQIIPYLSWLRISLNAGTPKTYSLIHRTNFDDFNKVITNLQEAVRIKRNNNYQCVIGAQFLLLNENYKEIYKLTRILKDIRVDYLIIKPYSQHPLSINRLKHHLNYGKFLFLEKKLQKYNDNNFKIIFRRNTMLRIKGHKPYKKCLGYRFYAYLTSEGDLYACSTFLGDKRFCYGNIYKSSFIKIWKSNKRKKVINMINNNLAITKCREACRLDEVNRYLWELKHPPKHVNFI